ncbi:MAG TPA: tetratricopeptide repeat protein [Burkholderiales bacterium]|nr:tetratricopeptide repeat protein [Burkholderiales bacterium]
MLRDGKTDEALGPITEAIALSPDFAEAHSDAGVALRQLGRLEEAAVHFQRAVNIRPEYLPALNNHGLACLELGRHEDAEDSFKLALALDPASATACFNLGSLRWTQNRRDEAIKFLYQATELDPGSIEIKLNLGGMLNTSGRYEEALECYRNAEALNPDKPETHVEYGITLLAVHRVGEAISHLQRALALNPDFPEALFNLGNAHSEDENLEEAVKCYRRAVALKSDYVEAWNNLGNALKGQDAVDQALGAYRKATALKADYAEAHHNMGVAFNYLGRPLEAIESYEKARDAEPGRPESQLNLAIARLMVGDFDRGWPGYEWRFRQTNPDNRIFARECSCPRWQGQSLAQRSVLVWGEQGIGDEILFSSMYREVIEAAKFCVIECVPKLQPLFARCFPGARVVPKQEPPHPLTCETFDYHSPAGGLARWLRPNVESFPAHGGHLVAAPERVAYWKGRLAQLGEGLKVGFSWRSINVTGERALHFTDLDRWEPVFRTPGVQFLSLQYDECGAELARVQDRLGVRLHAFPEVDLFNDLEEAAALTAAVDLVISAPTAVSLLAAALGVPTWQLTYGADWQIHGTHRNLWYPVMTQFKRAWNERWEEVLAVVGQRLARHVALHAEVNASRAAVPYSSADSQVLVQQQNLENVLAQGERELGQDMLREAAASFERAIALKADHPEALLKLGIVRYQQGLLEEADAAYGRVLELQPGHIGARVNRALTHYQRGDFDAAVRDYESVLKERPDHPEAHFNLAVALLARGELVRGWSEYEWRFEQETLEERKRSFPFPSWNGEDLERKTVLVWKEQSVGAQLLFAGMFPDLIARAGYCIIECTPKLVPLFARSFADCDVVPRTEPPHPYTQHGVDFQIPSGGLGRRLRSGLDAFPRHQGYLLADPQRVAWWRGRLQELGAGPKIGFSWRSISTRGERALACTALDQWRSILRTPGVQFVCLQYDECSAELQAARTEFGVPLHRFSDLDLFNDLDEAAALTRALDLVISAPTAASVLSAALGVPTWQLHHGADWQMHGLPRHPWLPALRRFQRGVHQPWEEVMTEIAGELLNWIAERGS